MIPSHPAERNNIDDAHSSISSFDQRLAAATTSLLILQPTPFCNIDCSYCYLPRRDDKSRMTMADILTVVDRVFAFPTVKDQLTIVWHAGEPLVLGPSFYDSVFARIQSVKPAHLQLDHSFQTNGLLLNEDWCRLIQKWNVHIGVSLDGPQALHDSRRRTRQGGGTFERAMKGVALLRQHEIPFYVITVLTQDSLNAPHELFAFYREHEITDVGFNIEELEGVHQTSSLWTTTEAQMQAFLEAFTADIDQTGFDLHVREIEEVLNAILAFDYRGPDNTLTTPFGIITVAQDGSAYTFSPEFAGFSAAPYGSLAIGNLLHDTFDDLRSSANLRRMTRDIETGRAQCREICDYFTVCGGGTPANKLFELGRLDGTETMQCRLTKKAIVDFLLSRIERKGYAGPSPPSFESDR
jgi:uncharacterized protein